ncbi:DUF305 domain-containing protein [Microbispora rosea subsp. aerata]|nr:DUF305 domain-containing protein [Microbispora rosea]GGO09821.1 DUF305 domain-containing protein [Microbispora rosea subsp. aerata]GIH53413.1 DUF305 domain-containing protein [Microbispora rosea subsp. aerata]GLJ83094.1 DUF305 domain-containing protein [Microbispora rosea subsp. aerata]
MNTDIDAPLDDAVETAPPARRRLPVLGLVVVILAAAALAVFFTRSGTPSDASPEAGFARDMGVHHAQAVEMSFILRDKTSDEPLRSLAYDIITTQSTQRGIFMGWLQQWGLDQSSGRPAMAWMAGHGHGGAAATPAGTMPGMATEEEMNRLRQATGGDAEVLFLQLMIRHHQGGVEMAEGLLKLSDRDEVRSLAQHIVDGQNAEIRTMKDLLAKRGAQPLPAA